MKKMFIFLAIFILAGCANEKYSGKKKLQQSTVGQRKVKEDGVGNIKKENLTASNHPVANKEHPKKYELDKFDEFNNGKRDILIHSMNKFHFFTNTPNEQDSRRAYIDIGGFKLSFYRIMIAIQEQADRCNRSAAYYEKKDNGTCKIIAAKSLGAFADMVNNASIEGVVKKTALSEATYGARIDFGHAARLAKMHSEMCRRQGDNGYALMVTMSAPCKNYKGAGIN